MAEQHPATPLPDGALTPSEVLRRARANVEHIAKNGEIVVVGEVWDKKEIKGGHVTFDLKDPKDAASRLPSILWFQNAERLRLKWKLEHGLRVVAFGKPTVTRWAQVQLQVDRLEPFGQGAHELAFQQLKAQLEAEGLFAPERKKPLPPLPRTVGVVTSSTGAALRDVVKVLFARMPRLRIVVAPTRVQGNEAIGEIADAIRQLDKKGKCDVILVVRGGGSLEDLHAFNSEGVARAIAGAKTPIISGVGHETDVTICDLVADKRAATPSNAAELAVPKRDDLMKHVSADGRRLAAAFKHVVERSRAQLEKARRRLVDPRVLLGRKRAVVADLEKRLERALARRREKERARLVQLEARLKAASPARRVTEWRGRVSSLEARLTPAVQARRARGGRMLDVVVARLEAISPLKVLARGYAIARKDDGAVVRDPAEAPAGTHLDIVVARGRISATVDEA